MVTLVAAGGRAEEALPVAEEPPLVAEEPPPAEVDPRAELAEHARRATALFGQREFAAAAAEFALALALAPTDVEQAALEFNLASCSFELRRFAEAEAAFVRSARLDPAAAALAWLDAGLAALRDGRPDDARRHLAAAGPGDAEVEAQRAELEAELARLDRVAAASELAAELSAAAAALKGGDPTRAVALLAPLLAQPDALSARDLTDVRFGLAAAQLALGDLAAARGHIDVAIALSPADPDLYAKRAEIALAARQPEAARRDLERALRLGLDGDAASWARATLAALDPLPPSGASGALYLGAAFDSNPAQSGSSETSGLSSSALPDGSALLSAYGTLGITGRLGRRVALRGEYSPSSFVLLEPSVRELSLQAHQVAAHLYLARSRRLRFRLTALSTLMLDGLEAVTPFVWENGGGVRVELRTGAATRTRLDLGARAVHGFDDDDALTGAREDVALLELVTLGDWALSFGARLRAVQAGTVVRTLTAVDFPACDVLLSGVGAVGSSCEGALYRIPLSHWAPGGLVDVTWSPGPRWSFGLSGGVEGRAYLDASGILAAGPGARQLWAASRKTRRDLRGRGGAHVEVSLDRGDHLALSADYALLVSRSNVAHDPDDPEHAFDYDDRRFTQHLVEGGLEARF